MSIKVAKWTFFLSLCASRITSFCLPTLSHCQTGIVFSSFFPCPLLLARPEFSSLEASEQTCAPNCNDLSNCILSPLCDHHDLLVELVPHASSWFHEFLRCVHALSSGLLLDSSVSLTVARSLFKRFFVPILQGIAASMGISKRCLAFLMVSL